MPAAMLRGSDGRWKVARWGRKLPAQEPLAPRLFLVQLPRGLEQIAAAAHAKQLLRLLRLHHRIGAVLLAGAEHARRRRDGRGICNIVVYFATAPAGSGPYRDRERSTRRRAPAARFPPGRTGPR